MSRGLITGLVAICLAGAAGCADVANTRNFAVMGTLLGTGAGVAIGAATGHIGEGAMIGAALGGAGGGMAGSAYDNYSRKTAEKDLMKGVQQDILGGAGPSAGAGPGHYETVKKSKWVDTSQKKRVWVEEKVADGKVVEAHFEDRLIPSGHWAEVEEQAWVDDSPPRAARAR